MAIKGLSWRVTDKPSWVNITPSNGVGDTNNISITVENSDVPNDEKEYDIKIECIDCESSEPQSIRVCRCVCSCDNVTLKQNPDTAIITEDGLAAWTVMATYEFKTGVECRKDAIISELTGSDGTSYRTKAENNTVVLLDPIPHTQSLSPITYTLKVYFYDENICSAENYTSTQDGLDCNCSNNFKNLQLSSDFSGNILLQKGYAAGTTVFTFDAKEFCPVNGFNATIGSKNIAITVDGITGVGKLASDFPKNTDNDKNVVLSVKYGNESCFSKNYTQRGCDCDNNLQDFVTVGKFAEIDPIEHIYLLPQSGLTAGSPVFTTTLNNDCPLNKIKVYLKSSNGSINIPVTVDNSGNGTLTSALAPNRGGRINLELHVEYGNDDKCYEPLLYVQDGCSCRNVMIINSMNIENLSSFGINAGTNIGTYSINQSADCDDTNLKGTLKIKTASTVYNFNCTNGNVVLTSNIPENIEKQQIEFEAKITYGDEECGDAITVYQNGVNCNCEDADINDEISFNDSLLKPMPKTGLTAGTVIGEYRCNTVQEEICSDVEFRETNSKFTIKVVKNGDLYDIILNSTIPDNDEVTDIQYEIKVFYKIHGTFRECDDVYYPYQKGLNCSCDSISIKTYHDTGDYPSFPATGTEGLGPDHDGWVAFASGDTGLYYKDGRLANVCGGICGYADSDMLSENSGEDCLNDPSIERNCVKTKVLDSEAGENSHLFEFYVKVNDISKQQDKYPPGTYTIGADIKPDWSEELCKPAFFGLEVVQDDCDCTGLENSFITTDLKCEGLGKLFGYGVNTINERAYVFPAIKQDENNHLLIDTFDVRYSNTGMNAKIPNLFCGAERNLTGERRVAGIIEVSGVCNPEFTIEGDYSYNSYKKGTGRLCGVYELKVYQEGCKCDCNYINKSLQITEYEFNFESYYDYLTKQISRSDVALMMDCPTFLISGEDGNPGNPYIGSWLKAEARSERYENDYGEWYEYFLDVYIIDGQHDNRYTELYLSVFDSDGNVCNEITIKVNDSICNCSAIRNMPEHVTMYIEDDYEVHYNFSPYIFADRCVGLFTVDKNGNEKMPTISDMFNYIDDNGQTAFSAYGSNDGYSNFIYIFPTDGYQFDPNQNYIFNIKWKYKDENGIYHDCDINTEVEVIKVNSCDTCRSVLDARLVIYNTYYNGYTGNFIDKLEYGHFNPFCGYVSVYIMEGYDERSETFSSEYGPNDELPYYMSYIGSGRELRDGTLYLNVDPLSNEEDSPRITDVRLYFADSDGNRQIVNGEYCYADVRLTEVFERKCTAIQCSAYSPEFKINDKGSMAEHYDNGRLIIPTEGTGGEWLIATFNSIPQEYADCFQAVPSSDEKRIPTLSITTGSTSTYGVVGIYLSCGNVNETISFFVDFNVRKKGINDATWSACSHNAIPVQAGPIS